MSIQDKLYRRPLGENVTILKDQLVYLRDLGTTGLLDFWIEDGVSGLSLVLIKETVEKFTRDEIVQKCEESIESMRGEQKTFQEKGDFLFINFNFRNLED